MSNIKKHSFGWRCLRPFNACMPTKTRHTQPDSPYELNVEQSGRTCTLQWDKPCFDGGTPVTGYAVEYCQIENDSEEFIDSIDLLLGFEHVISDLTWGRKYTFRVAAINTEGRGLWRENSAEIVEPPGACEAPHVEVPDFTKCILNWKLPLNECGAPVTGFIIEQQRLNSFGWFKTKEVDGNTFAGCIEGLMKGHKYQFCVTAVNKRGVGKRGLSSHVVETIGYPGQVNNLQVFDITSNYCRLRWSLPHDNGGSEILEYIIQQNCGNGWVESGRVDGNVLQYKVTTVEEKGSYTFRVKPINKLGQASTKDVQIQESDPITIKRESDDNIKEIERSCKSAVSNVENIIAAIQKEAQQSPSHLNVREFGDNLKIMSETSLLEVKIACEIGNTRQSDLNNTLQQLKVKQNKAQQQLTSYNAELAEQTTICGKMKEHLAQTQQEYAVTNMDLIKILSKLNTFQVVLFSPIILAQLIKSQLDLENVKGRKEIEVKEAVKVVDDYESKIKLINNNIINLNTQIEETKINIKNTDNKIEDEDNMLSSMNEFCNYITKLAGKMEAFHILAKSFYDIHLILSPLQDLVDFISSAKFKTCAVALKMEDDVSKVVYGINNLQSFVNESSLLSVEWKLRADAEGKEINKLQNSLQVQNNVFSLVNIQQQFVLANAQHIGWEEYIIPLPRIIACLGGMVLAATAKDFSLEGCPQDGFKWIKNSSSFHACILQIVSSTWSAMNNADVQMDKIANNCHAIPLSVHNIADYLLHGSREEFENKLPRAIKTIQDICQMNMEAILDLDGSLLQTINLVAELSECCGSSQGKSEARVKKLKSQLTVLIGNIKNIENQKKSMTKEIEREKEIIKRLERDYKEEFEKLPNQLEIVGMKVLSFDFNNFTPFEDFKKPDFIKKLTQKKTSLEKRYELIYEILNQFNKVYSCIKESTLKTDTKHELKDKIRKQIVKKGKEYKNKTQMSPEAELVKRICRDGSLLCVKLSSKPKLTMSLQDAESEVTSLQKELICILRDAFHTFREFRKIYPDIVKICEGNANSDTATTHAIEIKHRIDAFLQFYKKNGLPNISAASDDLVLICEKVNNICDDLKENNNNDAHFKSRLDGLQKDATEMHTAGETFLGSELKQSEEVDAKVENCQQLLHQLDTYMLKIGNSADEIETVSIKLYYDVKDIIEFDDSLVKFQLMEICIDAGNVCEELKSMSNTLDNKVDTNKLLRQISLEKFPSELIDDNRAGPIMDELKNQYNEVISILKSFVKNDSFDLKSMNRTALQKLFQKLTDLELIIVKRFDGKGELLEACKSIRNIQRQLLPLTIPSYIKDLQSSLSKVGQVEDSGDIYIEIEKDKNKNDGPASESAVDAYMRMRRENLELTLQELQESCDRYDKKCAQRQSKSSLLEEELGQKSLIEMKVPDLEKTLQIMIICLRNLAEIKEEWGKMLKFFQKVSAILECSLTNSISRFVDNVEVYEPALADVSTEILYQEVAKVSSLSYMVHMVTSAYCKVSENHIMPRMHGIHKLLEYNAETDKDIIQTKVNELNRECKAAQGHIKNMISQKQDEYHQSMGKRITEVEEGLDSLTGIAVEVEDYIVF